MKKGRASPGPFYFVRCITAHRDLRRAQIAPPRPLNWRYAAQSLLAFVHGARHHCRPGLAFLVGRRRYDPLRHGRLVDRVSLRLVLSSVLSSCYPRCPVTIGFENASREFHSSAERSATGGTSHTSARARTHRAAFCRFVCRRAQPPRNPSSRGHVPRSAGVAAA